MLEIDGASNRGIDEIREIRAERPVPAQPVALQDLHHRRSPHADAGGLQRPAEDAGGAAAARQVHLRHHRGAEDPDHHPVALPALRLRRHRHRRASSSACAQIVASERMQADDEALELVARRAGGSMRDAQSLLDQLLAFGGDRLTGDQVHQLLGTAHDDRVAGPGRGGPGARSPSRRWSCSARRPTRACSWANCSISCIDYWRDLMVVQCAGAEARRPERAAAPAPEPLPARREAIDARHDPGRAGRAVDHEGPAARQQSRPRPCWKWPWFASAGWTIWVAVAPGQPA